MENNPSNNSENPTNGNGKSYYQNIDAFILSVSTALNNAIHPDIYPLLLKRGYKEEDLDNAKKLVSNLESLHQNQKKEYAEQYEATQVYNTDWIKLNKIYADHLVLARIVFENDINNYVQLGLQGKRNRSFSGYMQQVKLFYNNALNSKEIIEKLATKGITESELKETQTLVLEVEKEKYEQNKETGEAQQATKNRDAALDELSKWFGEFKRTLMVDIANKPELGKIIGF
jgi:hypothetical protein